MGQQGAGRGDGAAAHRGQCALDKGSRPAARPVRPRMPVPAYSVGCGLRPVRRQRRGSSSCALWAVLACRWQSASRCSSFASASPRCVNWALRFCSANSRVSASASAASSVSAAARAAFRLSSWVRRLCACAAASRAASRAFGLLAAEGVQRVIGLWGALRLRHLRGQGIQLCSVPGVAVGLGAGSIQCGLCGGKSLPDGQPVAAPAAAPAAAPSCCCTVSSWASVACRAVPASSSAAACRAVRVSSKRASAVSGTVWRTGRAAPGVRVLRAENCSPPSRLSSFGVLGGALLVQRGGFGL